MDAVSKGKSKKSDVTRIFWPCHCTEGKSGLLVGWNVHSFTASVATVAKDIPLEMLHQALDIIGKSKRYSHLFFECGGAPGLLGEYRQHDSARQQPHAIRAIRQVANFWLTLDRHGNCPRLCDIHCCGFRYSVFSVTAQFVLYQQPNSSSYFSTLPFNPDPERAVHSFSQASDFEKALMQINESALVEQVLAEVVGVLHTGCTPSHLLWEAGLWENLVRGKAGDGEARASDNEDASEEREHVAVGEDEPRDLRRRKAGAGGQGGNSPGNGPCRALALGEGQGLSSPGSDKGSAGGSLRGAAHVKRDRKFLECPPFPYASEVRAKQDVRSQRSRGLARGALAAASGSIASLVSVAMHWIGRLLAGLNAMALHMVIFAMMAIRVLAQLLQLLLDCPVALAVQRPAKLPESERATARGVLRVRHVSAVARQLHCRLALLAQSPVMSPGAWTELQRNTSNARSRAVSVHFNSTVCVVGLDLMVGLACCSYVLTHAPAILQMTDRMSERLNFLLLIAIRWIMGVPAGLKLNDHLDFCLGNLCMLGIECYQVLYRAAHPLLPVILVSTAVSGAFGVTVMLCVMSDLLSLATLHIRLFYSLAARWHGLQVCRPLSLAPAPCVFPVSSLLSHAG